MTSANKEGEKKNHSTAVVQTIRIIFWDDRDIFHWTEKKSRTFFFFSLHFMHSIVYNFQILLHGTKFPFLVVPAEEREKNGSQHLWTENMHTS